MNKLPDDQIKPSPERLHGLKHLFAAGRFSMAGFKRMTRETAFRHEWLMGLVFVALFIWSSAESWQYAILGVLFAVLLAVETLNTAIEEVVDHVSPQWSEMARDAKDLGSFAVFCLLVGISSFAAWVILLA